MAANRGRRVGGRTGAAEGARDLPWGRWGRGRGRPPRGRAPVGVSGMLLETALWSKDWRPSALVDVIRVSVGVEQPRRGRRGGPLKMKTRRVQTGDRLRNVRDDPWGTPHARLLDDDVYRRTRTARTPEPVMPVNSGRQWAKQQLSRAEAAAPIFGYFRFAQVAIGLDCRFLPPTH